MKDFRSKFDLTFVRIIDRFDFTIIELSETEIALTKSSFALVVYRDRDGVGVNYIHRDNESEEVIQYPLGHFLATQRSWISSSKNDPLLSELEAYALTLENSASDILNGGLDWMNQINTKPFSTSFATQMKLGLSP